MAKLKLFTVLLFFAVQVNAQRAVDVNKELQQALQQYERMLAAHTDTTKIPHSSYADGSLRDMPSGWWTSGFFGATLWYLYAYTNDDKWKSAAHHWTMAVQREQYNRTTHDLGFMVFYPFGKGYEFTKNETYKQILLNGAESLASRFDANKGVIKSWDKFKEYDYPVIIDNMMNLDYLTWASRAGGNKKYKQMAITHADVTLKNHFRPDYSSYHVLAYGPNGQVLKKMTHQGYADESAWARGQAWALYGYTMMYRETKKKKYLRQAKGIADFFINHPNLPADKIPYWDFNVPAGEERDVSAATIACSGLLELSRYAGKKKNAEYRKVAEQMLVSLSSSNYRAAIGENNNFLLKHSVGHKPGNIEVDVPLIYADYYYIEALLRYNDQFNLTIVK